MTLYEQIKADNLQARKDRNQVKANVLSTLASEIFTQSKAPNRAEGPITDAEVLKCVKSFLDGINFTIENAQKTGADASKAIEEKKTVEVYMPQQMSDEQLTTEINILVAALTEKSMKQMGMIMKQLQTNFAGRYDAQKASALVKTALGV